MKTTGYPNLFNFCLMLVIGLLLLPACQSLEGASEPPLPTIVPVQPTGTSTPAATLSATISPTEPLPTVTTSSTPAQESNGDTLPSTSTPPASTPTPSSTNTPMPTATLSPTTPSTLPLDTIELKLNQIAEGFTRPVFLTPAGDGSNRLFVVEQAGRIFIMTDGTVNTTPFLDIVSLVGSDANEQGLLSMAFHPDYADNGLFFLNYTNKAGHTVIARYQVSDNPDTADPDSSQILLTINQPFANHNGGQIAFGPDGYLYVGMGDGGAANDPKNNGQTLTTMLGKILRLDIDHADPYGVPENNPFVNAGEARPEIWSYGWRNPWRFSFDPANGDMYVADVGQNQFEEVHVEATQTGGGQNYGWRLMEGLHCFNPKDCDPTTLDVVLPLAEYDHQQGCSITGGYVYRGTRLPALAGLYLYGDYCSGTLWGLRREANGEWSQAEMLSTDLTISSFGQDEAGELYLVNHKGHIFQIGN